MSAAAEADGDWRDETWQHYMGFRRPPPTPTGARIFAIRGANDNRSVTDVTEGVQALYDLVLNSMDWASGFMSVDDAVPIATIARVCGFGQLDEVEAYIASRQQAEEAAAFVKRQWPRAHFVTGGKHWSEAVNGPHDHVFSSVGRCMWPQCTTTGPPADNQEPSQ